MARRKKKQSAAEIERLLQEGADKFDRQTASIEQTTIFPTINAMFLESIASLPWFEQYSRETRRTIRFAFVTAVAETLRTVAFRLNSDQSWDVYDEFGKEIALYNQELLAGDDMRAAAILGLPM